MAKGDKLFPKIKRNIFKLEETKLDIASAYLLKNFEGKLPRVSQTRAATEIFFKTQDRLSKKPKIDIKNPGL